MAHPTKKTAVYTTVFCVLVVFPFSCSFGLLLALHTRLLVMFTLANLLLNACLGTVALKSAQSAVQRLILFHNYT